VVKQGGSTAEGATETETDSAQTGDETGATSESSAGTAEMLE